MRNLGYVVAAYAFAGGAIAAYLLALVRRQRSLERRLEQLGGRAAPRAREEPLR